MGPHNPACRCSDHQGGLSRRHFLRLGAGGLLGAGTFSAFDLFGVREMNLLFAQEAPGITRAKAKACILLWMEGGPSHIDTFDPKTGQDTGGPFKAIETSLKGIQIGEHLPQCARQLKQMALLRSVTSKEGDHQRGRYYLHTSYVPQGTVAHPSIGSITSMEIGRPEFDLPNFIAVGVGARRLGLGPHGAGFLPPEHSPFIVDDPGGSIRNLDRPSGIDEKRFRSRMALLDQHEREFAKTHADEYTERHKLAYQKADRLMHTPLLKAFELQEESEKLRKAYGDNTFGKGCLLARRLVEVGAKFIEVALPGWDTHQDNFTGVQNLCTTLDPALATLIQDLSDRRLLNDTLVVWMGEFGRTPRINPRDGRDHHPRCFSVVLAGGGIQGGRVIGASDETGTEPKERPVTVPDLMATIFTCLGIDRDKKNVTPQGRPIKIVDNGMPVKELLS